jgi:hypothetical protein
MPDGEMNATEKYLGAPCKHNHLEGDTGKTLRFVSNGNCCLCTPIYSRAKRVRHREALNKVRKKIWSGHK